MEDTSIISLLTSITMSKQDFTTYLLHKYIAYDSKYRPQLDEVLNNYINDLLKEHFDGYLNVDNIINTIDTFETLEKWAQEYIGQNE